MTVPLKTPVLKAGAAAVEEAKRLLAAGGLVAFPTETVYGLGADATNGRAIARLYEAKGRPAFNPLIAHVVDLKAAQALGRLNAKALRLAKAFWPGPLTMVLPKAARCRVAELATAGLDTIALRVPVTRISEIVRERRGITADTALRLARYFSMTPEFWMRLQMDFDLESAADSQAASIRDEIRPRPVSPCPEAADSRAIA